MPIWLRRYTFQKLQEYYRKEQEEAQAVHNKANNVQTLQPPITKPTYSTKARK